MKFLRAILGGSVLFLTASTLSAQSIEAARNGVPRANLISANPIGLLFEWYNGEFEHAVNETASLAIASSRYSIDNNTYSSVDGIARYYPSGRSVRGFSIGGSAGLVAIDDDVRNCFGCTDDSGSAFTIGVRGDYVWILGRDERFAVATGIGAKRLFGSGVDTEGLPIGRLSIGYAW